MRRNFVCVCVYMCVCVTIQQNNGEEVLDLKARLEETAAQVALSLRRAEAKMEEEKNAAIQVCTHTHTLF